LVEKSHHVHFGTRSVEFCLSRLDPLENLIGFHETDEFAQLIDHNKLKPRKVPSSNVCDADDRRLSVTDFAVAFN